jgi:hypothetical protein
MIEDLQQHSNNDIYGRYIKLLETYCGVEDEEEMATFCSWSKPASTTPYLTTRGLVV